MTLTEKNNILFRLGKILKHLSKNDEWPGYELGVNKEEYENLNELVQQVHIYNGWFKEDEVRRSFLGISNWLTIENLENWESKYKLENVSGKRVAIIMAGNIPLVGFHDLISVFLSGNVAVVKMSSDDKHLLPALVKLMSLFDESINSWIELVDNKIENFDAVIATGSDNSSKYFESYFGKYPQHHKKEQNFHCGADWRRNG